MQSTLPRNNQPKRRGGLGSYILVVVSVAISIALWLNHQYVLDTINYWRYQPSADVAYIATKDQLTDAGKFVFYAVGPSIDGSATFNQECERKESGTAILGCYVNNHIYIYDVTDAKLDGIKEVTAAHELLHAVYERMSPSERDTVNRLVEAEYAKLQKDPEFADRMAFYARTEPGERDNELHSIIGTEVSSISPELEAHYKKYFDNRSAVVALHDTYNSEFTGLSDQAKTLSSQLDDLNAQIKTATAQYNADVRSLNNDITSFNSRAKQGEFSSQSDFNSERQALVSRSNSIDASRDEINSLVSRYNTLRNQYNSIVTQTNDLYKSIDSTLAPAPKV